MTDVDAELEARFARLDKLMGGNIDRATELHGQVGSLRASLATVAMRHEFEDVDDTGLACEGRVVAVGYAISKLMSHFGDYLGAIRDWRETRPGFLGAHYFVGPNGVYGEYDTAHHGPTASIIQR